MTTEYHADIFERLMDFYTPEEADTWMGAPHPQLSGETPDAVIGQGVEGYVRVSAILHRLQGGDFL